ncbi:zinc-dependent alcohol dehydrogenase family protein [Aureivirga marina]|uniref:zinc-dependent alcohol dehydrogenase family protein n=1 Tax=Aureivirga marina TaxID=1182451 RepID=UPI0018CAECEC|nr:NAD(P)-dependent alcohol dehydrogenase [Aureivirga marina]
MKSIIIEKAYGIENISLDETEIPTLKSNQVLIKVHAISLNQLDLLVTKGNFGNKIPHILGSDAAGIIEKIGKDVTNFKIGDKVTSHFIQTWQHGIIKNTDIQNSLGTSVSGVFSEYIVLDENSIVKIPSNLNLKEASTLPIAALTAFEAVFTIGKLEKNQTILLQGTGGVSVFALKFAKAIGAKVILISSNDKKLEIAKKFGADEIINYKKEENWQEKVLELTNGNGVDVALEISWADINKTIEAMKISGKIVVVGMLGGHNVEINVFSLIQKSLTITAAHVGSKENFIKMNSFIENHNIQPFIDSEFAISEFKKAFHHFENSNHIGKIVLTF